MPCRLGKNDLAVVGLDGGGVLGRVAHAVDRWYDRSSSARTNSHSASTARTSAKGTVQASRDNGGSPSGVSMPPQFATMKIVRQDRVRGAYVRCSSPGAGGSVAWPRLVPMNEASEYRSQEDCVVTRRRLDVAGQVVRGDHEQHEEQRDELRITRRWRKRAFASIRSSSARPAQRDGQLETFAPTSARSSG